MVYFLNYLKRTIYLSPFLGAFLFVLFPLYSHANYLENYVTSSQELPSQTFYEEISFEKLVNKSETDPIAYYSRIEKVLEENNRQADTFF